MPFIRCSPSTPACCSPVSCDCHNEQGLTRLAAFSDMWARQCMLKSPKISNQATGYQCLRLSRVVLTALLAEECHVPCLRRASLGQCLVYICLSCLAMAQRHGSSIKSQRSSSRGFETSSSTSAALLNMVVMGESNTLDISCGRASSLCSMTVPAGYVK